MTEQSVELLNQLIVNYGYVAIAVVIGIESMGIPLPGETILVLASMYAAHNPGLNIWLVALSAMAGAIIGDNAGYWIGYRFGFPLLKRFGPRFGVPEKRAKVGQYLFLRYGFLVVFLGRFIALLRILAAFLAGVNRMHWPLFLIANAAGGVLWALVFAFGGYYLGNIVFQLNGVIGPLLLAGAAISFVIFGLLIRRYEQHLVEAAERALPGPIR